MTKVSKLPSGVPSSKLNWPPNNCMLVLRQQISEEATLFSQNVRVIDQSLWSGQPAFRARQRWGWRGRGGRAGRGWTASSWAERWPGCEGSPSTSSPWRCWKSSHVFPVPGVTLKILKSLRARRTERPNCPASGLYKDLFYQLSFISIKSLFNRPSDWNMYLWYNRISFLYWAKVILCHCIDVSYFYGWYFKTTAFES